MQAVQPAALHRSAHSCQRMAVAEAEQLAAMAALAAAVHPAKAAMVHTVAEAEQLAHITVPLEAPAARMAAVAEVRATNHTTQAKQETAERAAHMAAAVAEEVLVEVPVQQAALAELKEHTAAKAVMDQTKAAVEQMVMLELTQQI